MKTAYLKSVFVSVTLSFLTFLSVAQEETVEPELSEAERAAKATETLERARAFLGGSEKLDAIESVKMKGVLVYGSGESGTIEAVYQKPNYHQFVSVIGGIREVNTLGKSAAWLSTERLRQPGSVELTFHEFEALKNLEASVVDFLGFLDVPSTRKGRIEYVGTSEIQGVECDVLLYIHSDRNWFRRYIDPETGRVLHRVDNRGVIHSYEGLVEVDGVKFPEKTIVRFLTQFGEQTMEISISEVVLNEEIDSDRFRVPQ